MEEKEKLTINSVKDFETDVDYTTVLDNFEGTVNPGNRSNCLSNNGRSYSQL